MPPTWRTSLAPYVTAKVRDQLATVTDLRKVPDRPICRHRSRRVRRRQRGGLAPLRHRPDAGRLLDSSTARTGRSTLTTGGRSEGGRIRDSKTAGRAGPSTVSATSTTSANPWRSKPTVLRRRCAGSPPVDLPQIFGLPCAVAGRLRVVYNLRCASEVFESNGGLYVNVVDEDQWYRWLEVPEEPPTRTDPPRHLYRRPAISGSKSPTRARPPPPHPLAGDPR